MHRKDTTVESKTITLNDICVEVWDKISFMRNQIIQLRIENEALRKKISSYDAIKATDKPVVVKA